MHIFCVILYIINVYADNHRFAVSWKKLQSYTDDSNSNIRPDRILIRVECKLYF